MNSSLVLIGMPGCGKSTIGKALAKSLSKNFCDADIEFEKEFGIFPGDFIVKYGETAFRIKESQVLEKLLRLYQGGIIATGGGVVTVAENKSLLKGCTVIWLLRDLQELETKNRPLSINLPALFEKRKALYENFSDIKVDNNKSIEDCVEEILKLTNLA